MIDNQKRSDRAAHLKIAMVNSSIITVGNDSQ